MLTKSPVLLPLNLSTANSKMILLQYYVKYTHNLNGYLVIHGIAERISGGYA